MRKKFWIVLALTIVIPGFLFTASCAKKAVKEESMTSQQAENEAAMKAREAAEKAKQEELAKQRAMEEENLKKEAMDAFVNEDIYFDFDSSNLTAEAQNILKKKAQWLLNNPDQSATIGGHCDERGTTEYNLALGERRAASAKAFLVDLGVPASRLTTISYGEERPVDPGHNEAAWAKNRRCNFVIN